MAFKEFIFSHFPHRWLNKKAEGTKKLFTGLGKILDWVQEYANIVIRNNSTRTSVEILQEMENEYGIVINPSADIKLRRARIIAKKRMVDSPITKIGLVSIFEALGIQIEIKSYFNESIMLFIIKTNILSISFSEMIDVLHKNIRAHVGLVLEAPENIDIGVSTGAIIDIEIAYNIVFNTYHKELEFVNEVNTGILTIFENEYNISWKG